MAFTVLLSFKKLKDAELLVFASDVVARMLDNPQYQSEQLRVETVETVLAVFRTAVTNAMDGGHTLIQIRKEKRLGLLNQLSLLARMMDLHTTEDIAFFTEAGFHVRKTPVRTLLPLPKPVLKYVRQGVLSGSVDGEALHFPKAVREIGVEYSTDGGVTWQNGTYSTGKRFTLNGLEHRKEVLVRICYQGTRQRMSNWSEPMAVFVQ